jgi:hypothetical protein
MMKEGAHGTDKFVEMNILGSCHWNYGLDKQSTILDMKTLRRRLAIHAALNELQNHDLICKL